MPQGQLAFIYSLASGGVVAIIGLISLRWGGLLTRRTELDKVYMQRLETVEGQLKDADKEADALRNIIQELREQHIVDLVAQQKLTALEAHVKVLRRKLKIKEIPDDGIDDIIGI